MKPNCPHFQQRVARRQRGLSLIELMVALAIGVVLLLGLVQIFGASRAAFASAEGASRIQENARFAMDFLRRDIRLTAYMGLNSERSFLRAETFFNHAVAPSTNITAAPYALRLDWGLVGYEYTGSAPGQTFDLSGGVGPGGGAASYAPGLDEALGPVGVEALAGSDVLVLRFLSGDSPRINLESEIGPIIQPATPQDLAFFQRGEFYGISNNKQASLVQAVAVAATVNVGQGGLNLSGFELEPTSYGADGASVSRYEYIVYYVAIDPASGEPSLRQRRLAPGAPDMLSAAQTVVEGVESLQLVYGVDSVGQRDDVLDRYLVAGEVNGLFPGDPRGSWQRVLNVRVGLLMRSPNIASANRDAGTPRLRAADTSFDVANDGRIRQVFESVVALRNRVSN